MHAVCFFTPVRQLFLFIFYCSSTSSFLNASLSAFFDCFFLLHFISFLSASLSLNIVTSSFRFCFSSEHFHVSFFLSIEFYITQILSIRWKICKSVKWEWYEWKSACRREIDRMQLETNEKAKKIVCVFYFVCGILFNVLSGCLTCILHCLIIFVCECLHLFVEKRNGKCIWVSDWVLCCGTMKSRALVFHEITKSEANVRSTENNL